MNTATCPQPPPSPPRPRPAPSLDGGVWDRGDIGFTVFIFSLFALFLAFVGFAAVTAFTEESRATYHDAMAVGVTAWSREGSGCRGPSSGTKVAARMSDGRVLQLSYGGVVQAGWRLRVQQRGWIWGVPFGDTWRCVFAEPMEVETR